MLRSSALQLGLATLALSAKVGYFDSKVCVDSSGMEKCYADAEAEWTDCMKTNCEGQNIDCQNICSCIRTESEVSCAASHCWNQAYSCEYQETAGEIATWCIDPDLSKIPFYPAPDDAPGACSCNYGKLLISFYKSTKETDTCGRKGMGIVESLTSIDDIQLYSAACLCCAQSAQLSSFFEVCPDTNPSLLGYDELHKVVVDTNKNWSQCSDIMSRVSCGKDGLDFSPPVGESSGEFYKPDSFPSAGTRTLSNMPGTITSPVTANTFTWTLHSALPQVVTLASVDARPTGEADHDDKKSGDTEKDGGKDDGTEKNDGKEGESGKGQDDSGDEKSGGKDEGAASVLSPGPIVFSSVVMMMVMTYIGV